MGMGPVKDPQELSQLWTSFSRISILFCTATAPLLGAGLTRDCIQTVFLNLWANSIPDANASGTLVFSYIGFLTQELPISSRSVINVTL